MPNDMVDSIDVLQHARLLASRNELLEALIEMVPDGDVSNSHPTYQAWVAKARAAIANATGEE